MKADHNSHETGTRLPCREHPALCLSLFTFMFVPAVAGEIALGRWLTQFMPLPWTDCHAVFRTSDCRSVHFRNAYWIHHLAPADEALCTPEHSGHIFSRRSTRPDLL